MSDIVTDVFKDALRDYYYLLNRDYPEKPALKLVGDRYRLKGIERITLYRGITSKEKALARKLKLTAAPLKEKKLYIDGYNVLFTMMNYLLGKLIFTANDGFLRDCGEVYGKVENATLFYRAVDLLLEYTGKSGVRAIEIYFDNAVPGSTTHVREVEKKLAEIKINGKVVPVKSADAELKKRGRMIDID